MRNFFLAVAVFISMIATAEAQNSFAYQAVIRTAKGELVSNKEIAMQFSLIYDGKVVYSETQKPKTNQYGNVQVEVGKGQKVSGSFVEVPWSTMQVMMKTVFRSVIRKSSGKGTALSPSIPCIMV